MLLGDARVLLWAGHPSPYVTSRLPYAFLVTDLIIHLETSPTLKIWDHKGPMSMTDLVSFVFCVLFLFSTA